MALTAERLHEVVTELVTRPGHEKVRTLIYLLLVDGLGAQSSEILFERPLPEVHGRADALLGRTVLEFKSDLRREAGDAEEELTRYLSQREQETGDHFVGIATDGATFVAYELRGAELKQIGAAYEARRDDPRATLAWVGSAVAVQADLPPEPETVERELGKASLAYNIARARLAVLWAEVKDEPEVALKRELWARLLERVYGSSVDDDELFFQHTYLTVVAKTMALRVVGEELPRADDLLSGRSFRDAGIEGAVESDFFDWVLAADGAEDLIARIGRHVWRFRLREVEHDVLKTLYESLIDPEQRHELGEYYTPDWLATKMCDHVIERPLEQRVLDPACGAGTFLFHAARRFLAAASEAGLSNREAIEQCCRQVIGLDVHPVAVLIARVTYLLALGEERLTQQDKPRISVPVYLGDSVQWNTEGFFAEREVLIEVPDGPLLHFPAAVAEQPDRFDGVIQAMLDFSGQDAPAEGFRNWLRRDVGLDDKDEAVIVSTYEHLRQLRGAGRNHIWGYVARNLSRPVWLASQGQKADVVIGNPPWLAYRFMSAETQRRFRKECQDRGIWAGGKMATHQDLSAYFYARCVELYLRPNGVIALLMPYSALNRKQFEGFRKGHFGSFQGQSYAVVRFTEAWAFDETVQPLFPVPSCMLVAKPKETGPLPKTVLAASGRLPRRDATLEEAEKALTWRSVPWPESAELTGGSPYRERFHQGATLVPRMLCVVEEVAVGTLGANPDAPLVASRRSGQEKPPWRDVRSLRGNVESEFLRTLYLGESVAPFRLLEPLTAVVPWDEATGGLLDAAEAENQGHRHVARWLAKAERTWKKHGKGRMSFREQVNYYGKLTAQMPPAAIRVLYAASGTLPAAAILADQEAVVEHALYWTAVEGEDEAYYLAAILNSEVARGRIAALQAKGQWGARHFDKLMFELVIPAFDPKNAAHKKMVKASRRAEEVAIDVRLPERCHFTRARRLIREALQEDGVAEDIERLVARLLEGQREA